MSTSFDRGGIPKIVDKLSFVRIRRNLCSAYGVETSDCQPSGYLRTRERWIGSSAGQALLIAQWFEARGHLFNSGRPLAAWMRTSVGGAR